MEAKVISITPFLTKRKAQAERNNQKHLVFLDLRSEQTTIRIHARPTDGFVGPAKIAGKEYILLELRADLTNTRGLKVDENGIVVDLVFDSWFTVKLPWASVFGLESMDDARFAVWDEDAPEACHI